MFGGAHVSTLVAALGGLSSGVVVDLQLNVLHVFFSKSDHEQLVLKAERRGFHQRATNGQLTSWLLGPVGLQPKGKRITTNFLQNVVTFDDHRRLRFCLLRLAASCRKRGKRSDGVCP